MKRMIIYFIGFAIMSAFGAETNMVEDVKKCDKCKGKGNVIELVTCSICKGGGYIEVQIENKGMRVGDDAYWGGSSYYNEHYHTKTSRKVCSCSAAVGSTRGRVKKSFTCDKCDGTGKLRTGTFRREIVYSPEEKQEMARKRENKKRNKLKRRNEILIEQGNCNTRINWLNKEIKRLTKEKRKLSTTDEKEMDKRVEMSKQIKEYQKELSGKQDELKKLTRELGQYSF